MKYSKISLKHFLKASCGDHKFIRVKYTENNEDVWIMPPHHAWPGINEFDELEKSGRLKEDVRAMIFIDKEFNADEVYGDYCNWEIVDVTPSAYFNPVANVYDEVLDITIETPRMATEADIDALF